MNMTKHLAIILLRVGHRTTQRRAAARRIFPLIALFASFAAVDPLSVASDRPEPVQVMVLGTYHFGNPGLDAHNTTADDVCGVHRQEELSAVANALRTFNPTRVMVEWQIDSPDFSIPEYAKFAQSDGPCVRDEIYQIGFRLARLVGLHTVEGIDEKGGPDKPDYFPYQAVQDYARLHDENGILAESDRAFDEATESFNALERTASIAELLAHLNDPNQPIVTNKFYYEWLRIGGKNTWAGAELNAYWYMRNAKIFSKLMTASRPGDRIVVVFGGGHGFWLRHFAQETPGYAFIDPRPFLARASSRTPRHKVRQ